MRQYSNTSPGYARSRRTQPRRGDDARCADANGSAATKSRCQFRSHVFARRVVRTGHLANDLTGFGETVGAR